MSLVEAAAALDKLLRGPPHHQSVYAPPSYHSYPLSLQPLESPKGPTCSTPLEAPQVSALLPWNTLGYPVQDLSLPISPLRLPASPLDQSFTLPSLHDRSFSSAPAYPSKNFFPRPPQPPCLPQPSARWLALTKRPRTTSSSSSRQNLHRASPEDHRRKARGGGRLGGLGREEFVPLDPDKYKTELCRSYQLYGVCKYGARCNYAHGLVQLRGASRHGKYKTRNCQSYHHTGSCRYGARCSFIHDPEEGILKCSITNKEVLEALHYRPASEDGGRTASITWRLLETSTDPVPELHLIACSRPLEEELSHFLSSCSSPEDRRSSGSERVVAQDNRDALDFALSHESDLRTELFHEKVDLLSTLRSCEVDYCAFSEKLTETQQLSTDASQRKPVIKRESECHVRNQVTPAVESVDETCIVSLCSTSNDLLTVSQDNWKLDEDTLNKADRITCQEVDREDLKGLDVVQDILHKAPIYSATVWSDGTCDANEGGLCASLPASDGALDKYNESSEDEAQEKTFIAPSWQRSSGCVCKKQNAARSRRRKRRGRASSLGNEEPSWLTVHSSPTHEDDLVFSNTLRSDDSEEDRYMGANLKVGARENEDGWSEYGIHLADLLQSLRVQDCHQQVPWARASCRHSSDGSVVSHSSPPMSPSTPSALRPHDLTKYKTELCRSFQYNGYCGYGESCLYAHGSHDLRTYPKHPMYRTKQCFSFHQKGYCLYGSRCQFLHDLE
ncbi:uncharacterized protein LOC122262261 isoform X2 [Penaeus japonicus]|uniref:uncharacterized protein LOC122262261 isoform X2 n=1 Tax=Penaeus japonicus TaxID=27405 RepID=UPI001C7169EC|nr:uncharacterized protein LOC122262261 isoform X2 [Penaeus japonicus]